MKKSQNATMKVFDNSLLIRPRPVIGFLVLNYEHILEILYFISISVNLLDSRGDSPLPLVLLSVLHKSGHQMLRSSLISYNSFRLFYHRLFRH